MSAKLSANTFTFIQDLKANNNRPWFNEHKERYLAAQAEMIDLATELMDKMNTHDVLEPTLPKKAIFRIYRDVRFSKNKDPYKTHLSGSFVRASKWRRGGYYFHIEPGNSFLAGGFWAPERDDLKRIRAEIATDADPLREIITAPLFVKHFGELSGDKLKTAPRGYDKNHPDIDLLRYKQFLLYQPFTDKEVLQADLAQKMSDGFKAMRPFLDYMSEVLTTDANGVPIED